MLLQCQNHEGPSQRGESLGPKSPVVTAQCLLVAPSPSTSFPLLSHSNRTSNFLAGHIATQNKDESPSFLCCQVRAYPYIVIGLEQK